MYLNCHDYQTVWQLGHGWAEQDSHNSDPNNLPPKVKEAIYRIMIAIKNKLISVRTTSCVILDNDSFFELLFNFKHYRQFNASLKNDHFDKDYLESLFVWRPEVVRWCVADQLPIPPIWQPEPGTDTSDDGDDDDGHWYDQLSDRRKHIVAALHIADLLWKENRSLSYEDIFNHADLKKFDKPRIFPSLASFKEWARDIAPQEVKSPGRRRISV